MADDYPFDVLAAAGRADFSSAVLGARGFVRREVAREGMSRHAAEALHYDPGPTLATAINTAIALGLPLLLTGEPGTGKTQAAYYIARRLQLGDVLDFQVKSVTTARDLLYQFNAVRFMAEAMQRTDALPDPKAHVSRGKLWEAFASDVPRVLLIDEVDKASRDFPNDLLRELDQWRFEIEETGEVVPARAGGRPIVVITSNGERQLPEPFLRRCVYHDIVYDKDLADRVVTTRQKAGDYPRLTNELRERALAAHAKLRSIGLDRPPAIAELLAWLHFLEQEKVSGIKATRLGALPGLGVLVKTRDDLTTVANIPL